jgi:hypothetical protein
MYCEKGGPNFSSSGPLFSPDLEPVQIRDERRQKQGCEHIGQVDGPRGKRKQKPEVHGIA